MKHLAALVALVVLLFAGHDSRAAGGVVPLGLQLELAVRVAAYDKALPARARSGLKVAIVRRAKNEESETTAAQIRSTLSGVPTIAGFAHTEEIVDYVDAANLAATCKSRGFGIVYFAPGFTADMSGIAAALGNVDVLTFSTIADDAPRGAVVAFDLVGGKPKLLVNLEQSRKQGVQLSSSVLRLATVVP